jgi:enoyl-CoA hydratase
VTEDLVLRERRGTTLVLTFNRPEKLNALSTQMLRQLDAALDAAADDADVRVAVLTGAGEKAFVAGADIEEYSRLDREGFVAYQRRSRDLFTKIDAFAKPIVGAINGYALGGGFEIALCCDVLVASANARFGLPEGLLGLSPGGGGTQRLTRAVGPFVANDLLLSARRLRATEAADLGLISVLVDDPAQVIDAAIAKAEAIAKIAPLAADAMARLVRAAGDLDLEDGLELEQRTLASLRETGDASEGISAFVEKRAPRFEGA